MSPSDGDAALRDAERTKESLLAAAVLRFAKDGYAATTVRDIAADAGVNVALINRYFGSKEGLFEACLGRIGQSADRMSDDAPGLAELPEALARRIAGNQSDAGLWLRMLFRSSGDAGSEGIRVGVLRSMSESIAIKAGWRPEDGDDGVLLRAEVLLAVSLGLAVLRAPTAVLEPLASSTWSDLVGPIADVTSALLGDGSGFLPTTMS